MPQDIAGYQPRQRSEKVRKCDAGLLPEDTSVEVADVRVMWSQTHEFDQVQTSKIPDTVRAFRQCQVIIEHDLPAPDQGALLQEDLEHRARRVPAENLYPRPGRKARATVW